jgi:glycosyltransferase involved in cell wall biosynthesis
MTAVDVVVPSYNYAHYLRGCVESLLGQEGVDVRVLILDDASTDGTPALASQLLAEFSGLEYRRHDQNAGHIATYNEGLLGWATAPYVLLISADDLLAPGALKRAVDLMDRQRGIGMVCGMALLFESWDDIARAPNTKSHAGADEPDVQIFPTDRFLLRCVHGNPIATPTVVVRTELQRSVGPYATELPHTGDMEMWMRFAVKGDVAVTRFVQAYKRLHPRNMSKGYFALHDLRERFKAIECLRARDSDTYTRYGLSQAYVRQSMAEEALWVAYNFFEVGEPAAVRDCLQFATTLWPSIAMSRSWHKMQLKLRLGPGLCEKLRSLTRLLGQSPDSQPVADPRLGPRPGTLQGWWPEYQSGSIPQ